MIELVDGGWMDRKTANGWTDVRMNEWIDEYIHL